MDFPKEFRKEDFMNCTKCGAAMNDSMQICSSCGTSCQDNAPAVTDIIALIAAVAGVIGLVLHVVSSMVVLHWMICFLLSLVIKWISIATGVFALWFGCRRKILAAAGIALPLVGVAIFVIVHIM